MKRIILILPVVSMLSGCAALDGKEVTLTTQNGQPVIGVKISGVKIAEFPAK